MKKLLKKYKHKTSIELFELLQNDWTLLIWYWKSSKIRWKLLNCEFMSELSLKLTIIHFEIEKN
jgi:hypothetical protein